MDRGLLSKIPGDVLSRALHALPDAMVTVEDTLHRVVELPDGVRAKVTFARLMANRYSHKHNGSRWFWAAASAVIVIEQAKAVIDDNILSKIPGEVLTPYTQRPSASAPRWLRHTARHHSPTRMVRAPR